jgi:hypothetical protein
MTGLPDFSYSPEQWDRIAACVVEMRGVDVTDRIPREGGPSPRALIAVEAGVFCSQGYRNRRETDQQARFDNLVALRDNLQDQLVPTLETTSGVNTDNMLNATKAFITELTHKIDWKRYGDSVTISVFPERDVEPAGSNAAKTGRQQFWSQLLAIWTGMGGKQTGKNTVRFLIAASEPVFEFMRGDADASDKDRAFGGQKSVEQWLLRRRNAAR